MTTTSRRQFLGWSIAAGAALTAPSAMAAAPAQIITTTGMIADLVRNVGGDHVTVRALMGPGVDPHAYRQTRSDIVAMTRADAVIYHGLYLEAQMEDFFHDLEKRLPVHPIAENSDKAQLLAHDDYADQYDPHIWMDPSLWAPLADDVADALTALRPEAEATFRANAKRFQQEAADLQAYATSVLANVPAERRILVTAHDAFSYFGAAYGFDVEGIQGISTESEAGLNRISTLVNLLVSRDVPAVFVETSVSDRNVRALIEGAAAQGHDVRIGGSLFSDAMGPDGTYEGTWLGMIDHNVTTIAAALGAEVPANGRLGKLGS